MGSSGRQEGLGLSVQPRVGWKRECPRHKDEQKDGQDAEAGRALAGGCGGPGWMLRQTSTWLYYIWMSQWGCSGDEQRVPFLVSLFAETW